MNSVYSTSGVSSWRVAVMCLFMAAMVLATGATAQATTAKHRLMWNDDPATTMTVGWDQVSGSNATVYYGTKADLSDAQAVTPYRQVNFLDMNNTFAKITGLTGNSTYYFNISDADGNSTTYYFRTAPATADSFTFIAGGDSRTYTDPRVWGDKLVSKIRPLFVLFGGDYTDDNTAAELKEWLEQWTANTVSSDKRMYPIVTTHGNHENPEQETVNYLFDTPNSNSYYALTFANMMRVYVLNTELEPGVGYGELTSQNDTNWLEQKSWLANDMATNKALKWQVASYHRPMRPHTKDKSEGLGRISAWAETFDQYGMDLVIESDTHMVKMTSPVSYSNASGNFESFVRNSSGTMYVGEGSWGAPTRPVDDDKPWTVASGEFWQFKLVHVSPEKMDVRTIRFGTLPNYQEKKYYDPSTVTELTQAQQDADPFAIPAGLDIWKPLAGEKVSLPFTGFDVDMIDLTTAGDSWKYSADGNLPAADWMNASYDDSAWATGNGELGYGDGDETTTIDSTTKHMAYYFRKKVNVANATKAIKLKAWLKYDDGAVVYINGKEAFRVNINPGAVDNSTAGSNADKESEYHQFEILPSLLTTGENVIAVEVHQSGLTSSDMSFDMALVGTFANANGTTPSAPVVNATGTATNQITLTWTGNGTADRMFQVERFDTDSSMWKIVKTNIEAADTCTYVDGGLSTGTSYQYRVAGFNRYGLGNYTDSFNGTTIADTRTVIFAEAFASGLGQMTTTSVTSDKNWDASEISDKKAAYMNGYGADVASEDWLISPKMDLTKYANPTIEFQTYVKYDGGDFQLMVSKDYNGTNLSTATWTPVTFNKPADGSKKWTNSAPISLLNFVSETTTFAFKYTSTGTGGGDGAGWYIGEIKVLDNSKQLFFEDFGKGDFGKMTQESLAGAKDFEISSYDGNYFAKANSYGGDSACDDYLMTPAIDLSSTAKPRLQFKDWTKYFGGTRSVLVSTDANATANSTWTNLNVALQPDTTKAAWKSYDVDLSAYVGQTVKIAFRYTATGGASGDGAQWEVDDVTVVDAVSRMFAEDFGSKDLGTMTAQDLSSNKAWAYLEKYGKDTAYMNGYGADTNSTDWLITEEIALFGSEKYILNFLNTWKYGGPELQVFITDGWTGSAANSTWTELNATWAQTATEWQSSGNIDLSAYAGKSVRIGFKYTSNGTASGNGRNWYVADINVGGVSGTEPMLTVSFYADKTSALTSESFQLTGSASGGNGNFTYNWTFGDNSTATGKTVTKQFAAGTWDVSLFVTDSAGVNGTKTKTGYITAKQATEAGIIEPKGKLRVATFNCYLNRSSQGKIITDMQSGTDSQIQKVAEILQRVNPDIVLLNEFDYDANGTAVKLFQKNYLSKPWNGAAPVFYPYVYLAESNTGLDSGIDLNGDGKVSGNQNDAYGFGDFYGQYAMVLLSKYPILEDEVRTFQKFLWKDMPNWLEPKASNGTKYLTAEAEKVFRLSSKSHWDVPVNVDGHVIHILAMHPTPPTFDDGTNAPGDNTYIDWNGKRNHDEIRMFADYVNGTSASYLYEDKTNQTVALGENKRFIILGDLNADPANGDSAENAILQLLNNTAVNYTFEPTSPGGAHHMQGQSYVGDPASITASWKMHVDYVLPSKFGMEVVNGSVFWPGDTDVLNYLVGFDTVLSSDHRLVFLDLKVNGTKENATESCDITLDKGWNLVSLPVTPANKTLGGVLNAIENKYTSAWKWENATWSVVLPKESSNDFAAYLAAKKFGMLSQLDGGEGFWLNMDENATLSISGNAPDTTSITANAGWGLFGPKGNKVRSVKDFFKTKTKKQAVTSVWTFKNGNWVCYLPNESDMGEAFAKSKGYGTFESIKPGQGFWVNMNSTMELDN